MRRQNLTEELRQPYTAERGYGVSKVGKAGYENIWFVVPPPPPRDLPAIHHSGRIGEANRILFGRPGLLGGSQLDRLIAYLFIRREAVSSSRIEGTWSTIDHVLTPETARDRSQDKPSHESVRGYAKALEFGVEAVAKDGLEGLTIELICQLHDLVMRPDPSFQGVSGQIRSPGLPGDVVQIGGLGRREESIYNPAPPEHVRACLEDVLNWMRDETLIELGDAGMGMSLPVRMAIGHAHFEAVHPFSDGNGRIGRILWALQMAAAGRLPLYLSGYVEQSGQAYSRAMQMAQQSLDYGPLVDFVCLAVIAAQEEDTITKAVIAALPEEWQTRGRMRRGSSALRALDLLMRMPVMTARTLERELDISFQSASSALNTLTRNRIVRERTGFGRNRVFAAEEVIAVLARPFGEDPEIALQGARAALQAG